MDIPTRIEHVELKEIGFTTNNIQLLTDISFELNSNGVNTIIGPNGSGKTLSNKILGLLLEPTKGTMLWNDHGVPIHKSRDWLVHYRRKIGYMSQKPAFLNQRVDQNIELPLILMEMPKEERKKRVTEYLREFELEPLSKLHPNKLSLGQQQKLSLLIALIRDPSILILDEPTASLDPKNTNWFEKYIKEKQIHQDRIVVWTTHDRFQMNRVSDQVIFVFNGSVIETGPKSILKQPKHEKVLQYLNGELILD